jgi:hypothetical protein
VRAESLADKLPVAPARLAAHRLPEILVTHQWQSRRVQLDGRRETRHDGGKLRPSIKRHLNKGPDMKHLLVAMVAISIFPRMNVRAESPQPPEGFRALFNGQDLAGWHGLNPHSVAKLEGEKKEAALQKMRNEFAGHWSVDNGELLNVGTGPYATSNEEFGDIELLIDYKTVAKADSGIYLRGTPQVQIWDTTKEGGKWDRNADKGSGGLFNNAKESPGQLPLVHADRPFGEWNHFRIRQIGAKTWVWLNDKLVVDGSDMENFWDRSKPLPAKGPIMLQTHGGEIRWRNIFVREIGREEAQRILKTAEASK